MTLSKSFAQAKHLGVLTEAWARHVVTTLKATKPDFNHKLKVNNAVSVVAPAALVASILKSASVDLVAGPVRVMLLGTDPLIRLDRSVWASMAADLLGTPGSVEISIATDEVAPSMFAPFAEALLLQPAKHLAHPIAREQAARAVDLAIWLHPAVESMEDAEVDNVATAQALYSAGVPVFTASFNETDVDTQNYLLSGSGLQLSPLGGQIVRGAPAINRFGIATQDLGVEGGWGALLCQLQPQQVQHSKEVVETVKAATRMLFLEGAAQGKWSFGQRINGVAFNRVIPVGLLGSQAVDPATGHLFIEHSSSGEMGLVGHLWKDLLKAIPTDKRELLAWACQVKLTFMTALPKEPSKRDAAIKVLEEAFDAGVLSAGIGLARSYEAMGTPNSTAQASALYASIGDRHPLSAYSLAYDSLGSDDQAGAERWLRAAARFSYPVAMADLGKLLYSAGATHEGVQLLTAAGAMQDAEANYELGELYAKAAQLEKSVEHLRQAWTYGHAESAQLAEQICKHMLENGYGKRSQVKRELREVTSFLKKLARRAANDISATPGA